MWEICNNTRLKNNFEKNDRDFTFSKINEIIRRNKRIYFNSTLFKRVIVKDIKREMFSTIVKC